MPFIMNDDQSVVRHLYGDLVYDHFGLDAIAQGVNCVGVMGKGLAGVLNARFPGLRSSYKDALRSAHLTPGRAFAYSVPDRDVVDDMGDTIDYRYVINIASQVRIGRNARYPLLQSGLKSAFQHAEAMGITSIGFPEIGCGIGGLELDRVTSIIEDVASRYPDIQASMIHINSISSRGTRG